MHIFSISQLEGTIVLVHTDFSKKCGMAFYFENHFCFKRNVFREIF